MFDIAPFLALHFFFKKQKEEDSEYGNHDENYGTGVELVPPTVLSWENFLKENI